MLSRARFETRVLAEMAGLAASGQEYADVVHAVLDLVEQVVSSPYLNLSVQEMGQIGHYSRVEEGIDVFWADEVDRYVAEMHRQRLYRTVAVVDRTAVPHHASPAAWIATFPAETRSGRFAALTLGCPRALSLDGEEEQVMLRLARQAALVLDHAMLLQQLEDLETTDLLTGLLNQRRLLEMLNYELVRHRHTRSHLALLLLDVDGLDSINRSYGHQYGNHILAKLGGILQETVRSVDVVARCGMDEFAVILPETDDEEAQSVAERLRDRLLEVGFAGRAVNLTVGVAHTRPDEALTAEGFLRRGEQALHEAKRQERGWSALWADDRRRASR